MKIDFPFAYQVTASTSRWRSPRNVTLLDFVETDIPEVGDLDAPVSVEWTGVPSFGNGRPVLHHARTHQGDFYVPFGFISKAGSLASLEAPVSLPRRDSAVPSLAAYKGEFMELFPRLSTDQHKTLADWYIHPAFTSELEGKNDVEITASDVVEQRNIAEAAVSKLLLVDGALYMRVPEPRLRFATRKFPYPDSDTQVTCTPNAYEHGHDGKTSPVSAMFFRMDDMEALEEQVALSGITNIRKVVEVTVCDPASLTFDRTLDIAVRLAGYAMAISEQRLSILGRDAANAFYDLVDARSAFDSGGDRADFEEAVMDAVTVLAGSFAGIDDDIASELSRSVDLWSSSEIDFGARFAMSQSPIQSGRP